jgi:DNA-binding XRE family transcriptional regulator
LARRGVYSEGLPPAALPGQQVDKNFVPADTSGMGSVQTITLAGQRYVILPEAEYRSLRGDQEEPALPAPDAQKNYPAVEAARVVLARKLIRRRRVLGLTQAELAKLARVRVETISRLENARHSPNVATVVDKIVRALDRAEKGKRK